MSSSVNSESGAVAPPEDWSEVTEVSGTMVSSEQIARMEQRYGWASEQVAELDVLEVACGSGQGLGCLASASRSVRGLDLDPELVKKASESYGDELSVSAGRAEQTGEPNGELDALILFEALYYLPDPEAFFQEARRILKPGGILLISTANPDLWDFAPSKNSHEYLGVEELNARLETAGFVPSFFGGFPTDAASWRQRVLRPLKTLAVRSGLMPKTMSGKEFLKRLVFGKLVEMPARLVLADHAWEEPAPISASRPDSVHKVILCSALRCEEDPKGARGTGD